MAKIISFSKWIDGDQEQVYPYTHEQAVIMNDGSRLSAFLLALNNKVENAGIKEEEVVDLIKAEIAAITGENVDEAFDTIKEIADWILDHEDLYQNLITEVGKKVDKADGKGLSTEDFTTALKAKLEGIDLTTLTTDDIDPTLTRQYVTAAEKAKIDASARLLVYQNDFPSDATENDLVMQIIGTI